MSWLDEIAVGDTVVISAVHQRLDIVKVERLTKTQIIVVGYTMKFSRKDGYSIGESGYYRTRLLEVTKERRQFVKTAKYKRSLLQIVHTVDFHTMSIGKLKSIVTAIQS